MLVHEVMIRLLIQKGNGVALASHVWLDQTYKMRLGEAAFR
jgi:hypothetical protein